MRFPLNTIGRTDLKVPALGFGGAQLGGLFNAVDLHDAAETMEAALAAGITYVDTAPFYGLGKSERRIGDLLRGRDYTLSTKVGRLLRPGPAPNAADLGWPDALPFKPDFDYTYDGIRRSFEDSQQRLGLHHIDILFVHDIGDETHGEDSPRHWNDLETGGYRALDELRREGRVRAIGIGVNESAACLRALGIGEWDVFLLAGRYTFLEQEPAADLLPACASAGTSIVVGGPFNSGILVGGDTWNYRRAPEDVIARVTALSAHCAEFSVPMPAAALQFPLGHPAVVSVIPGLRHLNELVEALDWASFEIPAEFWQSLRGKGLVHPNAPCPECNPFKDP